MYRVFEALDQLVTIVEEARGLPLSANCVVPRGDVLELMDEVRDALPSELDDAQDVLDKRDEVIGTAQHQAEQTTSKADAAAERIVGDAQAEADRLVDDAREHADQLVAEARAEAERAVAAGRAEYEALVARARTEAERMVQAGRESYDRAVDEGVREQARLVSQTDVVQAAHAESARILDDAADEARRQRAECDSYVDDKLAEFEDLLGHTLRTVGKGRTQLRGSFGGVPTAAAAFDYRN